MTGWPKPSPKIKAPKPVKPRKPLPKAKPGKKPKKIAKTNAYCRPEWRALVQQVKARSKGVCEACRSAPATGDPHHLAYADFKGWRRLIVPLDKLVAVCRPCHLSFHPEKE